MTQNWTWDDHFKYYLPRLLTISAQEYCLMNGKNLNDYQAIGVNVALSKESSMFGDNDISRYREDLLKKIPPYTEVIVGFHENISSYFAYKPRDDSVYYRDHIHNYLASETALVPKSSDKK